MTRSVSSKPAIIKLIHFIIAVIIFAVPLFFTKQFVFSFTPEKTFLFFFLVETAFFAWLYLAFQRNEYAPKPHPVLITGAVFLAVYTLAGILGVNFETSFFSSISRMSGLLLLYHLAALVLILSSTVKDRATWHRFFSYSVLSAVLVSIVSYFGPNGFNLFSLAPHGGSTIGNSSYAGIYLVINIFLALFLARQAEESKKKKVFLGASLLILLSPMLVNLPGILSVTKDPLVLLGTARAATASLVIGLIIYVALSLEKKWIKIASSLAVLLVIGVMVLLPFRNSLVQKVLEEEGPGTRFLLWESAAQGIREKPLLGWGPENYRYSLYEYFIPELYSTEYGSGIEADTDKPHNAYLELAVTGGLLSLGTFLLLMFFVFRSFIRSRSVRENAAFVSSLSALLIYNAFFFDTLSSFLMVTLIVGYGVALGEDEEYTSLAYPRFHPGFGSLFALPLIASLWFFVYLPVRQQQMLQNSFTLPNDINYAELFESTPHGRQSMLTYLSLKNAEAVSQYLRNPNPEERKLFADNITSLRGATEPYAEGSSNYHFLESFVRLLLAEHVATENNDLLETARTYETGLFTLTSNNPEPYWLRAQRQVLAGETDGALKTLRKAEALWPEISATGEIIESVENYRETNSAPPFFL
jgi:O-antigen ligase